MLERPAYGSKRPHPAHPRILLVTGRGEVCLTDAEAEDLVRDLVGCLYRSAFEGMPDENTRADDA